jgi:hypothetical protein
VDYVKVDDIAASRLYGSHPAEIGMIRSAIDRCGRPIVLSLSPGPAPLELARDFISRANLWRVTDDFWDRWELLKDMFERCEKWHPHRGPGHWPDCDMLPLGHIGIRSVDGGGSDRQTRFSPDEQVTMLTLWTIFRSPLMLGGELRDSDPWMLSLLTNPEVLAVHRESSANRPVSRDGTSIAWAANGRAGGVYVALFNIGDGPAAVSASWNELGLSGSKSVRDLWKRQEAGRAAGKVERMLPPHGSALLELT